MSFHFSKAQVSDNFSDGDFSNNPTWMGDVTKFMVASGMLQSNAGVLATAADYYLSTPSTLATSAQWEFFINLKFATSGSNYADIFLMSDNSNLTSTTINGYFIRVGDTQDDVSFYRLTNGVATKLIDGINSSVNSSTTNAFKIRVTRDAFNLWTLEYDDGVTGTYLSAGSITDATFLSSSYFGIKIRQSTAASPANNHYFDDVVMSSLPIDTSPPTIISVSVNSSTELDVLFDEKVEATSSQLITNYSVNNGVGNPLSATRQVDEKTVTLAFSNSFANAVTSELTVTAVNDLLGNAITTANQNFFFFQPVAAEGKDLVITEIFADPSPSVGLPEVEFVELYNRSNKVFDLKDWKLSDGSSAGTLPSHIFYPGEYVILASTSTASQFTSFGTSLAVSNFPTLNNAGDALTLQDNASIEIDFVYYLDTWYRDDDKKQGGYSLELIDPSNPCGEEENWTAAEATIGGTPGAQNSVNAFKPDLTGPKLLSAIPTSATQLMLRFDEKLSTILPAIEDFIITPAIPVASVSFTDASLRLLTLTLNSNLQNGTFYSITVQNIDDCNGNIIQPDFNSSPFGLPEQALPGDVLINEILFNPRPTGIDFVEVYNNSNKFINLKNLSVANMSDNVAENLRTITTDDLLLTPGQYLAFSENSNVLKGEYVNAKEDNLYQVIDLPSFNDDEGSVALVNDQNVVLDFFFYSDEYHSVFLKNEEGVSLERISWSEIANTKSNWKSASSTVGYATPGYENSNRAGEVTSGKIVITPEIFEPQSGVPSFTQIQYNFEQGGFTANVKVLDFQGREIKQIANNEILGTSGFFRWDGDTNDGTKARTGYYVVWVEVFNASGKVNTYRNRVVIASKF